MKICISCLWSNYWNNLNDTLVTFLCCNYRCSSNTVFLINIYISKIEILKYWYQSTHLISRYQRHWTSILQLFVSQYLYPVWSPYFPLFIWLFIKCIHFFSSSINHGHGRRIIGRKFMENWCLIFTMRNVVSLSFGR